jgi:hypothetical protein
MNERKLCALSLLCLKMTMCSRGAHLNFASATNLP